MGQSSLPLIAGRREPRVVGYVLLDEADAVRFRAWRWRLNRGYATRYERGRMVSLHREILGLPRKSDGREGDHINRVKLDCRSENLRIVTPSQNLQNKSKYKNGKTSTHRGVYRDRDGWRATVGVDGRYTRRRFRTELEAAQFAAATRARLMPFSDDARAVS